MLSFVKAEEDLRIETSYPFNEVTAVFLLNNPRYHNHDSVMVMHHYMSQIQLKYKSSLRGSEGRVSF